MHYNAQVMQGFSTFPAFPHGSYMRRFCLVKGIRGIVVKLGNERKCLFTSGMSEPLRRVQMQSSADPKGQSER